MPDGQYGIGAGYASDLASAKTYYDMMCDEMGGPCQPLDERALENVQFSRKALQRSLWDSFTGRHPMQSSMFLQNLTVLGDWILKIFPMMRYGEALARYPQMTAKGSQITLNEWKFDTKILPEKADRVPGRLNRSEKTQRSTTMRHSGNGFEVPLDFLKDPTKSNAYVSYLEQMMMNIHLTWRWHILTELFRQARIARGRRFLARCPMDLRTFRDTFELMHSSRFLLAREQGGGTGWQGIESQAWANMKLRNRRPDFVIAPVNSRRFAALTERARTYSDTGDRSYANSKDFGEIGTTVLHDLMAVESVMFSQGKNKEFDDPSRSLCTISQRFEMRPVQNHSIDEHYTTDQRTIAIVDGDRKRWAYITIQTALDHSGLFGPGKYKVLTHLGAAFLRMAVDSGGLDSIQLHAAENMQRGNAMLTQQVRDTLAQNVPRDASSSLPLEGGYSAMALYESAKIGSEVVSMLSKKPHEDFEAFISAANKSHAFSTQPIGVDDGFGDMLDGSMRDASLSRRRDYRLNSINAVLRNIAPPGISPNQEIPLPLEDSYANFGMRQGSGTREFIGHANVDPSGPTKTWHMPPPAAPASRTYGSGASGFASESKSSFQLSTSFPANPKVHAWGRVHPRDGVVPVNASNGKTVFPYGNADAPESRRDAQKDSYWQLLSLADLADKLPDPADVKQILKDAQIDALRASTDKTDRKEQDTKIVEWIVAVNAEKKESDEQKRKNLKTAVDDAKKSNKNRSHLSALVSAAFIPFLLGKDPSQMEKTAIFSMDSEYLFGCNLISGYALNRGIVNGPDGSKLVAYAAAFVGHAMDTMNVNDPILVAVQGISAADKKNGLETLTNVKRYMEAKASSVLSNKEYEALQADLRAASGSGSKRKRGGDDDGDKSWKRATSAGMYRSKQEVVDHLSNVPLTYDFFKACIDHNVPVPLSFLIFRLHGLVDSGNTLFLKTGGDTGVVIIEDASITFTPNTSSFSLFVHSRFTSGFVVLQTDNLELIPDTFPMAYKSGLGVSALRPFTSDVLDYRGGRCNRTLHFHVIMYDEEPEEAFSSVTGQMDPRVVAADQNQQRDGHSSALLYKALLNYSHPDAQMWSAAWTNGAEHERRTVAMRAGQLVWKPTELGAASGRINGEIHGQDCFGSGLNPRVYGLLNQGGTGAQEFMARGSMSTYNE